LGKDHYAHLEVSNPRKKEGQNEATGNAIYEKLRKIGAQAAGEEKKKGKNCEEHWETGERTTSAYQGNGQRQRNNLRANQHKQRRGGKVFQTSMRLTAWERESDPWRLIPLRITK